MKLFKRIIPFFHLCFLVFLLTACMSSVTVWPSFVDLSKKDVILRVDKVAQIEDNLCHITECFVPDYGDHYIHLTYMSTDQDPLPSVSDSAFSTFHSYEIENGVARMYCFFAYIPEFSESYTVYINQETIVLN